MPKQLTVIDGADKGQAYLLPDAGTLRIGNSRRNTDICLHDLFVARVHCHVAVGDGRITVSDELKPNGIQVNGAKVAQQELQPGDVPGDAQGRPPRDLAGRVQARDHLREAFPLNQFRGDPDVGAGFAGSPPGDQAGVPQG